MKALLSKEIGMLGVEAHGKTFYALFVGFVKFDAWLFDRHLVESRKSESWNR